MGGRFPSCAFVIVGLEGAWLHVRQLSDSQKYTWIVEEIYVAPIHRGKGYAKALMQHFCNLADDNQWELRLSIKPKYDKPLNIQQLRQFYMRFGFHGDIGLIRPKRESEPLAPGSSEALQAGCRCPVIDNRYGRGIRFDGKVTYWYSEDCPIHGQKHNASETNEAVAQS